MTAPAHAAVFVWETLEAIDACEKVATLEQLTSLTFEQLGASWCFGLDLRETLGGREIDIRFGRWPSAWAQRYLAAHHADHDPVLHHLLTSPGLAYWSDVIGASSLTERQCRVFDEARAFGLRRGLAIPLHHPGGGVSALVAIGDGLDAHDPAQRRIARVVGRALGEAAQRVCVEAGSESDWSRARLTRREAEVLYWVRKGESDKAIALHLSLSPCTVSGYIRSAQRRLGASRRGVAAQAAWDMGLLQGWMTRR